MEVSIETIRRFDEYLRGDMSAKERLKFDQDIQSDVELMAAFNQHQLAISGIEHHALREKMNTWHDQIDFSTVESKASSFRWIKYLIGALLLLAVIICAKYYLSDRQVNDTSALFVAYYYPDPGLPIKMSDNVGQLPISAMQAYKNKNYEKAISIWHTTEPKTAAVNYYIASAYMAQNKFDIAKPHFENIAPSSTYYEKSLWYILLQQLKENQLVKARVTHKKLMDLPPQWHIHELKDIGQFLDKINK